MIPTGKTRIALIVVLGLLTFNLCVCGMFSYQGTSVPSIGPRPVRASTTGNSIRTGSPGGRTILGGGSSSGK